jgi:hypothetical protein
MNGLHIAENKKLVLEDPSYFQLALKNLKYTADAICRAPIRSVMEKPETAPSGDKHDYLSLARYFWPTNVSADNPDGLPYKRRDGKVNPDIFTIQDYTFLRDLFRSVEELGLAYYFLENETYVDVAVNKMTTWFIDPATRMTPHLNYAQVVKGVGRAGRSQGVIDMSVSYEMFDGVAMLRLSPKWNNTFQMQLKQWFTQYFVWLENATLPAIERAALNNHGTYYDMQYIATALFIDRPDKAYNVAMVGRKRRIDMQLTPDGRQPLEFIRAHSWDYAWFGLYGHVWMAQLSEKVGVNLWNYSSPFGASIKKAIDYLLPYAMQNGGGWPYENTGGYRMDELFDLLVEAYSAYPDPGILQTIVNMSFYQEVWTPGRIRGRLANRHIEPPASPKSNRNETKYNSLGDAATQLSLCITPVILCVLSTTVVHVL